VAIDNEEKTKLRESIANGYKRDEIELIAKNSSGEDRFSLNKEMRVCAYCRVSTDNIEQTTSYEFQRQEYTEKIESNDKWTLVDIYADEGISGTSMMHRDSFNRMINDCKKGLIDLILVKSVSRFARNVVDCLSTVEMLLGLRPPVRVIFESENIDTAKTESMFMLQIMAMMAEGESRNKSDIMKWSYNHRNSIGRFMTPRLFGYEIDKDLPEKYRIVEEEAEVIRLVFSMFSLGMSPLKIAEIMQKSGKISNYKHECKWKSSVVTSILDNERRCGELLASKTFTVSFKTHKSVRNGPDVEDGPNQYFVREHHDPIVPVEMFEHVVKMRKARKELNLTGAFPIMKVIRTGVLKGFVSVSLRYTGFDIDDYLSASNFVSEKGQSVSSRLENANLRKGDFSHFDLDGYELLDSQLFISSNMPIVKITSEEISFNKICYEKLGSCEAIEVLYEPHENMMAIRPCQADHPNAVEWVKCNGNRTIMRKLKAYGFSSLLFETNEWKSNFKVKVIGNKNAKGSDSAIIFNIDEAEPSVKVIGEDGKAFYRNYYPERLVDHFGEEYYQYKFSGRTALMETMKKWDLGATLESIESDLAWMKEAKKLVGEFLSR